MTVANLAYLNLDDVLADYVTFIDFYSTQLTGSHQWFTFGGSYSGALSAFFRLQYPEYTIGSLSSSGVVNTIFDFYQFDQQVRTACALVVRVDAQCSCVVHAGVNVVRLRLRCDHARDNCRD